MRENSGFCWRRFIWDVSEIAVERFVVVKSDMNDASGNVRGCFEIWVKTDTAKLANMITAVFGERSDLYSEP